MGTPNITSEPLFNNNNEKVYETHEKEEIHRQLWSNIFTQEDDIGDEDTEINVLNFIQTHLHRTYPFEHSNINRLHEDNYLIQPITNQDIYNTIRSMKKTCPGSSGINKIILLHIPPQAIYITTKKHFQCLTFSRVFP